MPRIPDPNIELRDHTIILRLRQTPPGQMAEVRAEICREYGFTPGRLSQIIQETAGMMPDEEKRAEIQLQHDLAKKRAWEHALSKGRAMFNGKGEHSIDETTGEYAFDPSPSIQALDILNRFLASESRLYGVDKPPPKPVEENRDLSEYMEYIRTMASENQRQKEIILQLQARLTAIEGASPADVVD